MSDQVLTEAEIAARLKDALPHWRLADGALCRVFHTHGWKATLMVVNTIGHLAEAAWHHPDLAVSYAQVEIRLSTHSAGGITVKDFELATRIEDVVQWQPATPTKEKHPAYIKYDEPLSS